MPTTMVDEVVRCRERIADLERETAEAERVRRQARRELVEAQQAAMRLCDRVRRSVQCGS